MKRVIYYLIPFACVVALWWAYDAWLPIVQAKLGKSGDYFSTLNALFSGLAFAALVVSIYLQGKGLDVANAEIASQKQEQAKQHFESSFFQLLNFSNEIVNNFRYDNPFSPSATRKPPTCFGKECFEQLRIDFASICLNSQHWGKSSEERYEKFYLIYAHDQLGHYFRNLYQIVKLIESSHIENKKIYTNIVRAQLSSHALYLLFYNGLSSFARERFFPLLIKYEFFEHLPVADDILQVDAAKYGLKAFGNSPSWETRFKPLAA